jgi:hypothetical protein
MQPDYPLTSKSLLSKSTTFKSLSKSFFSNQSNNLTFNFRFDANFGKEALLIMFKCNAPVEEGVIPIKIQRKTYRLEFQL